jgi:preprotein translocase SecE subunit
VGAFFQELLRADVYKRSQGRITRQVTFAALALAIALGLLSLGNLLQRLDPSVHARPAEVVCKADGDRIGADGTIHFAGSDGKQKEVAVKVHKGESLADVAQEVDRHQKLTGVTANVPKDNKEVLVFSSLTSGTAGYVRVEAPAEVLRPAAGTANEAKGRDEVNLGLHYWIPGLLLLAGAWVCYRLVNLPIFADFLIAVEAEMNKVSWPTRPELFRASTVVLILIFSLAIILGAYDLFWGYFIRVVLGIGA